MHGHALTQIVVRPAEPGGLVSLMLAIGEHAVDADMSAAEALNLALGLLRNARIAGYGECLPITLDELLADRSAGAARLIDMAILALQGAREAMRSGDTPTTPATN